MNTKWQYNEFQHSGVNFSNVDEVKAYDDYMQKMRGITSEIEKIKTAVELESDDVILEIGTGTGELAIGLSPFCKKVFAIDISLEMLRYAEQKANFRGLNNITFQHTGYLTCTYQPGTLDTVISQFTLHHLPDFWKMVALKRVYAMLKVGGKFYLQDVALPSQVNDYNAYLGNVVEQIEKSGGEKVAQDTEITIRDEYPTIDWILENLLKKAGFSNVQVNYAPPFIGTYLCTK